MIIFCWLFDYFPGTDWDGSRCEWLCTVLGSFNGKALFQEYKYKITPCLVSIQLSSGYQAAVTPEVAVLFDAAIRGSHNLHMSVAHIHESGSTKTMSVFYGRIRVDE